MPFNTDVPLTKPLYNIGQTIYLRESASLGFIEAYTIKRPTYELDGTIFYELVTGARAPDAVATIGDRITGRPVLPLKLRESDLILYCPALELAIDNLALQLTQLQNLRLSAGCPDVTE